MKGTDGLEEAISRFGAALKPRLSRIAIRGEPEDQLRGPFQTLLHDLVVVLGFSAADIVLIGETSLADLKTQPDYAVARENALIGFIELKAPGKGADPRKFRDKHDREQWEKLKSLPNLIYTDGNSFSLWRSGVQEGEIVRLEGSVETSGAALAAPGSLLRLLDNFLLWKPVAPKTAMQLAEISARLCRFLRDEVVEQMALGTQALTDLATDWRKLLFPNASNFEFADGYAQAVTFGLLMARAQGIALSGGLGAVSSALTRTNTLIGSALRLLTDDVNNQNTLKTSLLALTRVLDVVEWPVITLKRIIGFEIQFGPFAVAQLRLLAEVVDLLKSKGSSIPTCLPPAVCDRFAREPKR